MDGEGTFTIKRYTKPNARSVSTRYQAWVSCGFSNRPESAEIIHMLKEKFGGSIARYEQKAGEKRLDTITWQAVSSDAVKCASSLLPYLRIKRQQALILVDFVNACETSWRLSDAELKKRATFWESMRRLNMKGRLRFTGSTTERINA